MTPDYHDFLTFPTKENTHPADIDALKQKYGNDIVDEAVKYLTYKKTPPPLPKNEEEGKPILYVFRHGQSQDNVSMIFSGWRNSDLTEKGHQEALAIAPLLADKKIDMLFTSDQYRAMDTMRDAMSQNPRGSHLPLIKDKRLRERCYGDWQGYSKLEKHLENPELLLSVRRGWDSFPPNGESLEIVNQRVMKFLKGLIPVMLSQNLNVAISCHGNSMRPIRKYFEKLTNEEAATIETPTGKDYASYVIT